MKTLLTILVALAVIATAQETVGERPYEMVWAGRTQDTHPPLIDFENLDGWTVETKDAVATFTRSREQQLWGNHVGKLTYRATGKTPVVTLRLPQPVPLSAPFDCVNLWLYGNNWAWVPDKTTPQVNVNVLFRTTDGKTVRTPLGNVRWKEWFLMHHRCHLIAVHAGIAPTCAAGKTEYLGFWKDDGAIRCRMGLSVATNIFIISSRCSYCAFFAHAFLSTESLSVSTNPFANEARFFGPSSAAYVGSHPFQSPTAWNIQSHPLYSTISTTSASHRAPPGAQRMTPNSPSKILTFGCFF